MLGTHKLEEHSIPFKRKMKHQRKITSTNLKDYNKKSTIIVALFLRYLFKSTHKNETRYSVKGYTVFTIVLILIQNLSTTTYLSSALSVSEGDIQSTVV